MKQEWLERYHEAGNRTGTRSRILLGFNTNIDVMKSFEELDFSLEEVEAEELRKVETDEDALKVLKYCRENGNNIEVSLDGFELDIDGEERIGGQAGIMSNFLAGTGNRSVLYTPFLSEDIAEQLKEDVVYPVADDGLVLKSISDAVNSDRTKKNRIIEFEESSSRVIFSDSIRGFGPYFRKGVEEKFPELQESVDRAIFSGFHDIDGNFDSKLRKAEKQMRKLYVPKHLEFVSTTEEKDMMILEKLAPCFTSIGMDESELTRIGEMLGYDMEEDVSLGNVYMISKKIIQNFNVSRVHVHTKRFQSVVANRGYPVKDTKIRDSLLFSGLAAASMAETGDIPESDDIKLREDRMHVTKLDDLEHFQDFFGLEGFAETGTTRLEDFKVIAAPTLIHEEPKRLVGMGDIISSGAFAGELH